MSLTCAGLRAIHLCQSAPVLRFMFECTHAWIDSPDGEGRSPMMHAVLRGQHDVIAEALKCGASVSLADAHGHNALHLACLQVQISAVLRPLAVAVRAVFVCASSAWWCLINQ
jgi:hypothetical protein